jgi:hypothetical protein
MDTVSEKIKFFTEQQYYDEPEALKGPVWAWTGDLQRQHPCKEAS